MIVYILIIALLMLVGIVAWMEMRAYRLRSEVDKMNTLVNNINSYAFLINDKFEVEETNYYALNPGFKKAQPNLLGNVLRCKVGCDSGSCGSDMSCKNCPVRFVISKAFDRREDIHDLEVGMEIYDGHKPKCVEDVDLCVGGRYINKDGKPRMVLNVKNVSESKRLLRRYIDQNLKAEVDPSIPKLLFATQNVARYNELRELMIDRCRVVYAETSEQVLNRVGGTNKDFGYSVVLLDASFAHSHHIVDEINPHIVVIKLMPVNEIQTEGRLITLPDSVKFTELKNKLMSYFE
ncbi:hypothetical protein L6472_09170 [Prevotella sp. E13-17]|uniref:hypothetical protein n=1 Tax=Prevotella sp. E13-17 TaxID=2913616 RepID=UPI001EDB575D|nr:hypothetical protein [Prevotella sp. E13-17]UKK50197.1 hypothetical protein L6472_09170 [Prevotella sp. E13-17]